MHIHISGDKATAADLLFRIRVRERMISHHSSGYAFTNATCIVLQPVLQGVL